MENKRRKLLAVLFLLFCLLGIAALYGQARQPAEGTGGHSSNRQKVTLIAAQQGPNIIWNCSARALTTRKITRARTR